MPGTLRLVVDTNLFHECHKLDAPEFPWAAIGDFHAIELLVHRFRETNRVPRIHFYRHGL